MPPTPAHRAWIAVLPSWYPTRALTTNGIFVNDQNAALASQGYDVEVFYAHPAPEGWRVGPGIVEWRTERPARGHLESVAFQIVKVLARTIRRRQAPALIVANSPMPSGLAAAFCAQVLGGVPFVMVEHISRPEFIADRPRNRAVYSLMTRAADVWGAVSEPHLAQCLELLPIHAARTAVIPNVVSNTFFDAAERLPWSAREGLVFVGHLQDDRKGLPLVLEAMSADPALRHARLQGIGRGPMQPAYAARAAELGLDNVHFLGEQTRAAVADLLSGARVFVLPTERESFGLAPLEALAARCRVVCTPMPSLLSVPTDEDGLTVLSDRSPALWTEAIALALNAADAPASSLRDALVARHTTHAVGRWVLELAGLEPKEL